MKKFMQCITVLVGILFFSHVLAANKVVVIPMGDSASSGVQSSDFYARQAHVAVVDSYPDVSVSCDAGDYVTGGGFSITGTFDQIAKMQVISNSPTSDRSGWYVSAINNGGSGLTLWVDITCANTSR